MKTFSRRVRKAEALFATDPSGDQAGQLEFDALLQEQDDPYALPDSLPEAAAPLASPVLSKPPAQTSPGARPKPVNKPSAGTSKRPPAEQSVKQPVAEQALKSKPALLTADLHASKPRSGSSKGAERGSGRSTNSTRRSRPAAPAAPAAQDKAPAPASRSGRLLGAHKGRNTAASPAAKRKAANGEPVEQGEVPSKKPRAPLAAGRPKTQELAPALLAGSSPNSGKSTAAAAAAALAAPLTAPLPVAMAKLLNPSALRDSAPAQTVMEAQELGEQARYRDDAMWALDGLCMSGSANSLRESAVALLDICITRRGRLALRSGGVADEVMATLAKLKLSEDPVLALGAAAILACFCQADADPTLLAKEETAQLITALLKIEESLPSVQSSAPASFAGRIVKVLREGPFSRLLPQEEASSPPSVVLAALAALLDPNQRCVNIEPCKHTLRTAGALQLVAQLAADNSSAISDAAPTMQTVSALWKLNRSLVVLENACFACPDNEAHLAGLRVSTGGDGSGSGSGREEVGLAEWVVRQVEILGQQGMSGGFKKDCLRALLAVLMNMTQNNPAGCESVVAGGVLEAVTPVLAQIVQGGPRNKGCIHDRSELEGWVDELSCCLGLLINLMEHQPDWRQLLRELPIPQQQPRSQGGSGSGAEQQQQQQGLVPLLCALVTSVVPASRYADADGPTSPLTRRLSSLSTDEITVEALESSGPDAGAASIVEVYAAMLLGFLVEGSTEARRAAAELLPARSLEPVVAAVRRCLHFYVNAGAMTKGNEDSLRQLLTSLEEGEAEEQSDGAGAGQDDSS